MRHLFTVFAILFTAALPCHAQGDKPKPNTLTPKEIADGWILLFDGETTFGWTAKGEPLKVSNGILQVIGGVNASQSRPSMRFTSAFEMTYEVAYSGRVAGPEGDYSGLLIGDGQLFADGPTGGKELQWKKATIRSENGRGMFTLRGFESRVDEIGVKNPPTWQAAPGVTVHLRNIKLRPLNTKPLFNGTDLTGWKEFPGKKSKFSVTDGAINVKDGPGDLQTVGKFKDFILQLECKSNGKHLNSGIFFRCRDNEYQNGYEAQIRNQFTEKPEQKYVIEEFDPKTNKLIGKKEQFFTAVDYGTGAIYRRQPARKQMSKDGEWFTMTVVAHGNHLATWVNGVQVTDWYDNRPKSDNARTGCKLDAGHISIQGHDPTTDLSFKNIRIAEFK